MISCPTNASPDEKKRNETRNIAVNDGRIHSLFTGKARLANMNS